MIVEAEIEGDGRSTWWYVCGECHCAVNYKVPVCPCCKNQLNWKGFELPPARRYTGEQTEPAE